METNKPTTREKLKTYFETGDYPTQNQFVELIDSLKHKDDIPTNKEAAMLNNKLQSMGYVAYYGETGENFSIVISSQDEEDQLIEMEDTPNEEGRQYLFGDAPYTIKAKTFPTGGLSINEYYHLYYQINSNYVVQRLFGNNLPTVLEGFEFGTIESKRFFIQLIKQDVGRSINNVHTNIRFVNNTGEFIQYKVESGYWSDIHRTENTVTDHYNAWDYLYFSYKADLRKIAKNIVCKVYNVDNNQLLTTTYLYAGQNYTNAWGGQVNSIRNIRIECNYQ